MSSRSPRRAGPVMPGRVGVVALAALAYIPALLSSPGRMPADTKLYLYLGPRRLVSDAVYTFDPSQFAGWVPHQLVAYAWPSGPWYVLADAVGLPDWVAHRLWIGTILFAAGTGVAWAARRLHLSVPAALAAGIVYQLSPYLVPYIGRTSSMLLPWAGLGWIIGLTVRAATRTRWRDAAVCALVIGTVGAVNTTALLMIAPAPVLWLAVAAAERTVAPLRALAAGARIGGLALLTSAWWIAMQLITGRHGADLLAYSESLEDVSLTATSTEVWRSLGYWLTYIRDPYAPTTTAGRDYMADISTIVSGWVLVVGGVLGLALTRFSARRFAIVLAFTGVVLAVGVHPFGDPSPVGTLFRGDGQEGLSLALRSSTRALPLLTVGLALGLGAGIEAIAGRVAWRRYALATLVAVVAVVNLPVLTTRGYVDPALVRDQQPPDAWLEAAAALDAMPEGYRVLQIPGAEFGAYTWGYTVDPPLPALTDRPVVTRDLLPLGSPSAMDLVYALDDRFQTGRPEIAAVAPIARLLGADVVWLPGDAAFDRFQTPRPEVTSALFAAAADADVGLGTATPSGEPAVNAPQVPMVDEQSLAERSVGSPVAPVELVPVVDPVTVIRATAETVVVSGSGDGLVDAAAAGLIEGHEAILYSATLSDDELARWAESGAALIVTDSNRQRAHHWRSSQDVTGLTEVAGTAGGSATGLDATLSDDSGDARLPVFPGAPTEAFTTSRQDGPVSAVATSYGERFTYQPESRPAMAIDGDPNTAWAVLDPAGQYIEVRTDAGVDHVTLLQPNGLGDVRRLRTVRVSVDGGEPIGVVLDDRSLITGQRIEFAPTDGPTTIRISLGGVVDAEHNGRPDRTPVGFAEINTGLGQSPEVIVTPTDMTTALLDTGLDVPVTYVLTRERVRPTNRWRSDPEWRIVREIDVAAAEQVDVATSVRVDRRASDAVLAALIGIDGPLATARLTGVPGAGGWAAADGDPETAWITPFNDVVGAAIDVELLDPGVPLTITQRSGNYSLVTLVRLTQGDRVAELFVADPDGDGTAELAVPEGFAAGPLRIEIGAISERTTRDRRFADTVLMPAAISELGNVAATTVPERFAIECREDLVAIDGEPVAVRVAGSVAAAFAGEELESTVCDDAPAALDAGTHLVTGQESRRSGLQVDRIVLDARAAGAETTGVGPEATVVEQDRLSRTVRVDGCDEGCWLIVGEGYNKAWAAATVDGSLGEPQLVAGGFNGWWLPPQDGPVTVWVRWTAQAPLNAAIALSLAGAFMALVLAFADRPSRPAATPLTGGATWATLRPDTLRRSLVAGAAWPALTALFVAPEWTWWGLAGGAAVVATRRIRLAALVAAAALVRIAVDMVTTVRADHPPATPGFALLFENLHDLGMFAAVSLAVSALAGSGGSVTGGVPKRSPDVTLQSRGSTSAGAMNTAIGWPRSSRVVMSSRSAGEIRGSSEAPKRLVSTSAATSSSPSSPRRTSSRSRTSR